MSTKIIISTDLGHYRRCNINPNEDNFVIVPNPASNQANIYLDLLLEPDDVAELQINDLIGRSKGTYRLDGNADHTEINLSSYTNGVYICTLVVNGYKLDYERLVIVK